MRSLALTIAILLCPAVAAAATATVSWDDMSDNETAFVVERKTESCTGPGAFAQIGTVAPNIKVFLDNNFVDGILYCYRVAAALGESKSYSAAIEFKRPLPPTNLKIVLDLIRGFVSTMVSIGAVIVGVSSVTVGRVRRSAGGP